MKSKIVVAIIGVCLLLGLLAFKKSRSKSEEKIIIGILQTASHPALDRARIGFKEQILKNIPSAQFIEQNGEGIASAAQSIAAAFHANDAVVAIFAIGTPAAQAIARVEKQKPIIFAAVTDPKAAGLLNHNVSGTSDRID